MSQGTTRRLFLKLSGLGLAATATAKVPPPPSLASTNAAATRAAGEIAVWVTSDNRHLARAESLAWHTSAGKPGKDAIMLDPGKQFQEMLGFGAAFTDAACYMFQQLPDSAREQLFHELFHPAEMGLSVGRTCIGSSDYST